MFNPLLKIIYINEKFRQHPLAKNNRSRSWINYLLYNIKIRINNRQVKFKWVNGLNIYVGKGDSCLGGNVFFGLMEFHESAFLVHYLKSSDFFVDVGANLGHYTLLASGICGSKTMAIEPIPRTFKKLSYNVMKNNINKLVTIKNIGVSDEKGRLNFTDLNNNAINYVQNDPTKKSLSISVQTLNNLLIEKSPNLMKIDVEGYELFVLKGANKLLKSQSLKVIIIEINGHCRRYGKIEKDVYKYILNFGFKPVYYNAFDRKINLLNHYNHDSDSTIFIKDLKNATNRVKEGTKIQFGNNYSV